MRFTYIRSADVFLKGLDSFSDRFSEANQQLVSRNGGAEVQEAGLFQQEAKKLEAKLESLFESTTSATASLYPTFLHNAHTSDLLSEAPPQIRTPLQQHLEQLLKTYAIRCSVLEHDYLYLQEKRLFDLTGELVLLATYPLGRSSTELEARVSTVLRHFPESESKLGKLHSTLVSLKNSHKQQSEQSKFYLQLGAISIAALAFALLSDNWVRMFLVSAGLCGLLSVLVLRNTINAKGPEVALSQAAGFLVSPTQMELSGQIQRLFATLADEEPLIVTLLVGVKNSAVLAMANALAR
jgi:hypothetical protein